MTRDKKLHAPVFSGLAQGQKTQGSGAEKMI